MNILYLINYLGGGGTEAYIYTLAKELKDSNNIYIAYSEKANGYNKFKKLGVNLIHLPMNSPYDFKAARKLKEISKEYEIDLIHSHFLRENAISVLAKLMGNRPRLINTRHMLLVNTGLTKYLNRFISRFDDYIIAVSRSVKELLYEELGRRDNIRLIYTGLDLASQASYDFREEMGLSPDTILITSTARFSKEKGHEFIVRSLPRLEELVHKDFRLVFIGDGPELNNIVNISRGLGVYDRLIFTGYQEDIQSILNSSDIFLLASETEAFGISILEAMATRLPVVATDSGGTCEIIPRDSDYGILIDYGDQEALATSLSSLILDPDLRRHYGEAGHKLVAEKFNLKDTIRETYSLYSK